MWGTDPGARSADPRRYGKAPRGPFVADGPAPNDPRRAPGGGPRFRRCALLRLPNGLRTAAQPSDGKGPQAWLKPRPRGAGGNPCVTRATLGLSSDPHEGPTCPIPACPADDCAAGFASHVSKEYTKPIDCSHSNDNSRTAGDWLPERPDRFYPPASRLSPDIQSGGVPFPLPGDSPVSVPEGNGARGLTGSDPRSGAVPRRAQYAGSGVSAGLRAGKSAPRWCRQCASTAMHTDWRDGPRPARRACELRCHAGAGPGDLRDHRRAGTVRICPPARTCSPVCPRPDVRSGPGLVPVCRADGFRLVGPTGRMCRRWLFRWPRHAAIPGRGLGRAVTRVPSGRAWQGRVRCFAARVRLHGAIRGQAAAGTGRQDGRAEAGPLPRRCSTPRRWTTCGQTDGGRQAPGRHASLAGLPDQRAAGACPDGGRSVVGPIPPWPCG